MEIDALFGRSTENSPYRKKAISLLRLTQQSTIPEVACGIGYNFKIVQSYLQGKGRYIAIDISPYSLAVANGKIKEKNWGNIKLVNISMLKYDPEVKFDAIL
ncbi:MAG: methyltransferase domain-containing protein, partial [Candidatus Ranarchaeia archaeon]